MRSTTRLSAASAKCGRVTRPTILSSAAIRSSKSARKHLQYSDNSPHLSRTAPNDYAVSGIIYESNLKGIGMAKDPKAKDKSGLGKIKKMSLRDVWPKEAYDFTPWLEKNIDTLSNALGFDLEIVKREARVGNFSLDLLAAESNNQESVVIENQLTKTDHDHLGKLITYASGRNASIAILIAESIQDEHKQALNWLNQKTDSKTQFFAVEVEVFRIDDSRPTVRFQPIVIPSEWQKSKAKSTTSEKGEAYRKYFQALIDLLRQKRFTNATKGQPQSGYAFPSGTSGIYYAATFGEGKIPKVQVYIDSRNKATNEKLFDALKRKKQSIHNKYGSSFEWNRHDKKQRCLIELKQKKEVQIITMSDKEQNEVLRWHSNNLLKMKRVFASFIEAI